MENLNKILDNCKEAAKKLALLSTDKKNHAIKEIAQSLRENKDLILQANKKDLENAKLKNISQVNINRLELTASSIDAIASDMEKIALLDDPIGEICEEINRPNGLKIIKERVPFGVICAIFESRPNVCIDISCLALKTSNAVVLRGGSEAINTNIALIKVMRLAILDIIDPNVLTLITDTDRQVITLLIQDKEHIDLVVPRGGKNLIATVVKNATVPFIETGAGNCHLYIHTDADIDMAIKIAINAKTSRPAVCNSIETILVDKKIAKNFLPILKEAFTKANVLIKGCKKTKEIIEVDDASEEDYYQEYNDYTIAVKVVSDIEEAINHINHYGTKHSDAIISQNEEAIVRFMNEIDSACVYSNASTRFSDGGEFGFGAELGISTQKLHARGPMGLKEMTTYKYKIYGAGQIR